MSESVALQQQGSVSMSVDHVTTKDHAGVLGLDCQLGSCLCLRTVKSWLLPSLAEALRRIAPEATFGSTVELTLVLGVEGEPT